MRHSKLLSSPAEALFYVYAPKCRPNIPRRSYFRRPVVTPQMIPTAADFKRQGEKVPPIQDKLSAYKINENIAARWVQTRLETGRLSEPKLLNVLLDEIDPSQVVVELSSNGPFPDTAVVKVVEKEQLLREASAKERAVEDVRKQAKVHRPKQIELNWAISEKDLDMKLRQMAEFLDKGKKVEILLAAKRRQRKASSEEAEAVMSRLRDKIDEVGAKEVKGMTGKLQGQVTMTVQKVS